ncbi:hypothetical protein V9T40_010264 [Parthenolecanium corni]|uniref:Uncharacterized protein n=1 Tax=Parthenolecanium corni TaxID=536013 RepID=A0AAN9TLJ7_9HEMI
MLHMTPPGPSSSLSQNFKWTPPGPSCVMRSAGSVYAVRPLSDPTIRFPVYTFTALATTFPLSAVEMRMKSEEKWPGKGLPTKSSAVRHPEAGNHRMTP